MEISSEFISKIAESHNIEGTYGDGIIQINTFKIENNPNVTINIHGTFGSMNGGSGKYRNFAETLATDWASNVVLYESSRKQAEIDPTTTDRYKQKQAKFIGKTFSDELEDTRRVLRDTIENSSSLFGIEKKDLIITLNGNSLGWILAFYLAQEFSEVKNIVSVGTGLRLEIKDIPILDTFPEFSELKEIIQAFRWKYLMIHGTEDDVFTLQSFVDLIDLVGSEEKDKTKIELTWVDHTFGKLNGEESTLPFKRVTDEVCNLLKEEIITEKYQNFIDKNLQR